MDGNIDLDAYNYDIYEILEIVGLDSYQKIKKKDVINALDIFIEKNEKNDVFLKFFMELKEKTSDELHNLEDNDYLELNDSDDEKNNYEITHDLVINDSTYDNLKDNNKLLYNKILREQNRNTINIYGELINIRSQDRPIINYIDVCNPDSKTTEIKKLGDHTNFDMILAKQIKNIIEIRLRSIEIPYSWYTFSNDYGTNYFSFKLGNRNYFEKLEIPSGNYNVNELVNILQEKCDDILPNTDTDTQKIKFSVSQNKLSIKNLSKLHSIKIEWSSNRHMSSNCYGGAKGQKINYNLGWLLGFRNTEITIPKESTVVGDVLVDVLQPKYLILVIEDFNNNKPSNEIVATKTDRESYKLPKYWNKLTMEKDCKPIIIKKNNCHLQQINYDLSSNLTQKQKYTVDQIKSEMNNEKLDIYQSTIIKDVFAKIPLYYNNTMVYGQTINMENIVDKYKRIYFGPVNLKKLKIKLLDERGNSINLNGMVFSFTLEAVRQQIR
jgi:hypothetical protein